MIHILPGIIRQLHRAQQRDGIELEQAAIRLVVAASILVYVGIDAALQSDNNLHATGYQVAGAFAALSFALFGFIVATTRWRHPRRVFGVVIDNGFLTMAMLMTDAIAAPLFAIYLWVSFGNGFRFGIPYLALSAGLAIVGFGLVYQVNPYWHQHGELAFGIILALVLLPAYVAALLRRLQREKKKAEEANQAKSRFLSHVTHELRTPLNGIIGLSELLSQFDLKTEPAEYVSRIQDSGQHLLRTINDILDTSRLEADRLSLEHVVFDLHETINACIEAFRLDSRRKGLSLIVHFDLDLPYRVIGDPHRTRQILTNIVGNAIKFTTRGSVIIEVKGSIEAQRLLRVHLAVIDTGIGMSPEALKKVYQPFTQADASTTRTYGGTGLGITIAKRLIDLMGGNLSVVSEVNKGTRFDIELPYQVEALGTEKDGLARTRMLVVSVRPIPQSLVDEFRLWGVAWQHQQALLRTVETLRSPARQPFDCLLLLGTEALGDDEVRLFGDQLASIDYLSPLNVIEISSERPRFARYRLERYSHLYEPANHTQLFNAIHSGHAHFGPTDNVRQLHVDTDIRRDAAVLVADDHETNALLLRETLRHIGIEPTIVTDGTALVYALQDHSWDLVISDLSMPEVDGIEAYQLYVATVHDAAVAPFILLTANLDEATRQRAFAAGISHLITKPVSPQRLQQIIIGILDGDNVERESQQPEAARSAGSSAVLNTETLEQAFSLNPTPAYMLKLTGGFIDDTNHRLAEMAAAIDMADPAAYRDSAHAIKGAAAYLGLEQLHMLAHAAREIDADDLAARGLTVLQSLERAWPEAQDALNSFLDARGLSTQRFS